MRLIQLSQGKKAIVDSSDYHRISKGRKWCAAKRKRHFVAQRAIPAPTKAGRTTMLMHRFIMNAPKGMDVDHKNGNTLDNRKRNLRIVSNLKNLRSFRLKESGKTSKYRGVCWYRKHSRWAAGICFNYRIIHIGYFAKERDAAKAYDKKAVELGFDPAALNFKTKTTKTK